MQERPFSINDAKKVISPTPYMTTQEMIKWKNAVISRLSKCDEDVTIDFNEMIRVLNEYPRYQTNIFI